MFSVISDIVACSEEKWRWWWWHWWWERRWLCCRRPDGLPHSEQAQSDDGWEMPQRCGAPPAGK